MESKLDLDLGLIKKARRSAHNVAADVQRFIDEHTTVAVERTVCRLLGIDGVNSVDAPYPNIVVDHLVEKQILAGGAAFYLGNAMAQTHLSPQEIAEKIDAGEIDLSALPIASDEEIRGAVEPIAKAMTERIAANRAERDAFLKEYGDKEVPYIYLIVATGNIYEDITQAVAAAKQGADTAVNNANQYQNEQIPAAEAAADKITQQAEAQKEARIAEAQGQTARLTAMYEQYRLNPVVTRQRLFYETLEDVLPDLKVIVDDGNVQTLLPLGSLTGTQSAAGSTGSDTAQ